jgi:EPS-associated MarR family transcriptional regulator
MHEQILDRDAADTAHKAAPESESHLEVLRLLEQNPEYSQRQLSAALGLSLGKTHYVLKALLNKGLVIAKNFQRNDNKLAYLYVLTPQGVSRRAQLTRMFLARKEAEFENLRREIEALRRESVSTPVDTQQ